MIDILPIKSNSRFILSYECIIISQKAGVKFIINIFGNYLGSNLLPALFRLSIILISSDNQSLSGNLWVMCFSNSLIASHLWMTHS